MKILHTADWHVGATLMGRDRLDETATVLQDVRRIADERDVDAVLIAGDVFDGKSPSGPQCQLVYQWLEQIGRPTVLCVGNHESPVRWRAVAGLLRTHGVFVVDELVDEIVEVSTRHGRLQVAAAPWIEAARVLTSRQWWDKVEGLPAYAEVLRYVLGRLTGHFTPGAAHVTMGHWMTLGATLAPEGEDRSERTNLVGDDYAVPGRMIPASQYTAVGHLHCPQQLPRVEAPARYAGSLIQLDFGEEGQQKSAAIVELELDGEPEETTVEVVPLTGYQQLRRVEGTEAEVAAQMAKGGADWYKITVKAEERKPGLADEIREAYAGRDVLKVCVDLPPLEEDPRRHKHDLRTDPGGLFREYLTEHRQYDGETADELTQLFGQLMDAVEGAPMG